MPIDLITVAEKELVLRARNGKCADLRSRNAGENDPAKGASWTEDRTIRADVILALATRSELTWPVGQKGVRVNGARITGKLDFEAATITCPLALTGCYFEKQIVLKDAHAFSIDFSGCYADGGINGSGMRVEHDLRLGGMFRANGQVALVGARIGGDLDCEGGQFEKPSGVALLMDRVDVKGSIFLRKCFSAIGEARLVGATVGGDVECRDGHFENLEVNRPRGECQDVNYDEDSNEQDCKTRALNMAGIRVRGHVFLKDGFIARGQVTLRLASIDGQLACRGGKFANPKGPAIDMNSLNLKGGLFMNEGFEAKGGVDLTHAKVGVIDDHRGGWPTLGFRLDGLTYGCIDKNLDAKTRLPWLRSQTKFHPQPYEQLARVMRESGNERDAQRILFAKHQELRRIRPLGLGWLAKFILEIIVGYGYRTWLAAFWLLGLLLLGWGVANLASRSKVIVRSQSLATEVAYPEFHPLLYSLDQLHLPLDLHQNAYWRLDEKPSSGPWFWAFEAYFVFHTLIAWILISLFVAAVTGIIKKE
jgi:hypothetical protein